jgi:protein-tyrosine phosphatase
VNKKILFLFLLFSVACASMPWHTAPIIPERVSEGVYRGPHPDFQELKKLDIQVDLSLEDNPEVIKAEREQFLMQGIEFISVPLSEFTAPSPDDLRKIVDIIQTYRGINVYVHCRRGIDRTGYAIAAFRIIVDNWPLEVAYKEVIQHGHNPVIYSSWKASLEKL